MTLDKSSKRIKIKARIRSKISGSMERPRLAVFRSNQSIYAQLIDDLSGVTLVSVSSSSNSDSVKVPKVELSKEVGKKLALLAIEKGINSVVFDRGGYLYHGRIKALAEGAREGGLNF
jgi:large subunit ribosomal protein L18